MIEDPAAPDDEEDEEDKKLPAPLPGDITVSPPPPPAEHGLMEKWWPKVLDFGLGIVDAKGRGFFSYATEAGAREAGGLARVLGIEAATGAGPFHVVLIRFGAKTRGADLSEELMFRGRQGWYPTFVAGPAWVPPQCPQQTDRGMAMLLSTLYVVCDRLSLKAGAEAAARGAKLLQHLELVTGSPFAALAFRTLLHGKRIAALEKAALAAAMFGLIKRLTAHLAPTDDARRSERAFEHTRAALYYLLAIPAPQKEGESGAAAGSFSNISLQCDVSGSRLADPVRVVIKIAEGEEGGGPQEPESGGDERRILSRAKAEELIAECDAAALTKLGLPAGTDVTNAVSLEPDPLHAALLLATPFLSSVNIWQAPPAAVDRSLVRAPAPLSEFDFSTLANMAGKQA